MAESWESSGSVFSGGCGLVGGVRVGVNWEGSGIFLYPSLLDED